MTKVSSYDDETNILPRRGGENTLDDYQGYYQFIVYSALSEICYIWHQVNVFKSALILSHVRRHIDKKCNMGLCSPR